MPEELAASRGILEFNKTAERLTEAQHVPLGRVAKELAAECKCGTSANLKRLSA
jgi:hypothetical protein